MVDDEVDEHANPALLRAVREFDEVAERAVTGVDTVIVGHIIAVVAIWGDLKRHQPDRRNPEAMQVIQPAHQTLEVTDAVAIGIHVGSD
jgi:hypothetical protein